MRAGGGGLYLLVCGILGVLLLVAAILFLAPVSDCPVCTAKDLAGYSILTSNDIVALREGDYCGGKGKTTPYRAWKLRRHLAEILRAKGGA